jgi:hypothetical protein
VLFPGAISELRSSFLFRRYFLVSVRLLKAGRKALRPKAAARPVAWFQPQTVLRF